MPPGHVARRAACEAHTPPSAPALATPLGGGRRPAVPPYRQDTGANDTPLGAKAHNLASSHRSVGAASGDRPATHLAGPSPCRYRRERVWELIACLCGETVAVQQRDAVAAEAHQATVGEFAEDFGGCLPGGADEGLAALTKTGDGAGTETYIHDANNNVINQTIKGTTTTFNYDRNRLLTASAGGTTSSYNYDPFGRLDTVTAAGTVLERNVYDGFDHVIENGKNNGSTTSTTKYTYDPLDRTTTKTTDAGGAKEKTTTFNYNGLGAKLVGELHAPSMA